MYYVQNSNLITQLHNPDYYYTRLEINLRLLILLINENPYYESTYSNLYRFTKVTDGHGLLC